MPPQGIIATIANSLRPTKRQHPSGIGEEERLIASSSSRNAAQQSQAPISNGGDGPSAAAIKGYDYGTSSWPDDPVEASMKARREAELAAGREEGEPEPADADQATVWREVDTNGLDGQGSVGDEASVKGDVEERPSPGHDRTALTKTPYLTLALEQTLLLPLLTLVVLALLLILAHYAWPPLHSHRDGDHLPEEPEPYPHPFAWRPFALGAIAGLAGRSMRGAVGVGVEACLGVDIGSVGRRSVGVRGAAVVISTLLHTTLIELLRLMLLPLMAPLLFHSSPPSAFPLAIPSTSSLLQAAYHLGAGWGIAEAMWGIAKGWGEGLRIYKEILLQKAADEEEGLHRIQSISPASSIAEEGRRNVGDGDERDGVTSHDFAGNDTSPDSDDDDEDIQEAQDEEDLDAKIDALVRMRSRRELESALGIPYPNINFALHILWRIDTILLNLGLTLLLAAFFFNPVPLYRRPPTHRTEEGLPMDDGYLRPVRLLPLVVVGIITLHTLVSLTWSLGLRRLGLGAVTWGSLILSLMSLFAGLGCWGALV